MERIDFASVMTVLRRYLDEDLCSNQMDLSYELFADFVNDNEDFDFDNSLVCKWFNGLIRLSPRISGYYHEPAHRRALEQGLRLRIFPMLTDLPMAVQQLRDLILQDASVSEEKKQELLLPASEEAFVCGLLCFAMARSFQKRQSGAKRIGSLSPAVQELIFDGGVPRPCRWFQGREAELLRLHDLLDAERIVFLRGIPGIGKSEFAKLYAKRYGKTYTNVLYLPSSGDLRRDIRSLEFADDRPEDTGSQRLQRHLRLLRTLKEDSLLIVDNYNTPVGRDDFLDTVLGLRCSILFTTRCRYEDRVDMELGELEEEELLALVQCFVELTGRQEIAVREMIGVLHRHTFAVELAARLLEQGLLSPRRLLHKLKKERSGLDDADEIGTQKDGHSCRATYYGHIHTLFALCKLGASRQQLLSTMTLMPMTGIPARRFGLWTELPSLNGVNSLVELGLIALKPGRQICLHPMIREVALSELPPKVSTNRVLLEHLRRICQCHGVEIDCWRSLFETVESIMDAIDADEEAVYVRFLEDVYPYMEKYSWKSGMERINRELTLLLSKNPGDTVQDQALLLDSQAFLQSDPAAGAEMERQAIAMLGEINPENAHLAANLHGNLSSFYRNLGEPELARIHLEQGLSIFRDYDMEGRHDHLVQYLNYAALLQELGDFSKSRRILEQAEQMVRTQDLAHSLDYASVQESLGYLELNTGNREKAKEHFHRAMHLYVEIFADEPDSLRDASESARQALALCR